MLSPEDKRGDGGMVNTADEMGSRFVAGDASSDNDRLLLFLSVLERSDTTYPSGYSFVSTTSSPTSKSVGCFTSPRTVNMDDVDRTSRESDSFDAVGLFGIDVTSVPDVALSFRDGVAARIVAVLGRGVRSVAFGVGEGGRAFDIVSNSNTVARYDRSTGLYLDATRVWLLSLRRIAHAFSVASASVRVDIKTPAGGIRMKGGGEIVLR